jgi:plastocyanin
MSKSGVLSSTRRLRAPVPTTPERKTCFLPIAQARGFCRSSLMNKKIVFSLFIFACFTVLLGACKIVDASTLPKATSVQMGSSNFIQQEVSITKGQSVNLVNSPGSNHIIANGQWLNGAQQKVKEANAPTENDVNIAASSSLQVGPFTTPGDYHIYCTIHPGMTLTIHVK